ncbi:MAG: HEAT repeat domain-containing protein [Acidobacteriia bacterium]|nr:HEAT repeat domain-containing protein [Terriglobia bacterium]
MENLAKQCRDHNVFQTLCLIVNYNSDDELAVRSAIVRALPNWDDSSFPTMAVVRALSIHGLRGVAVETLDKMGPAKGEKESRLLTALTSLPSGDSKQYRVAGLPVLFGRDYRVLDYLNEMLRTGNRWERALAASELCGLGEVETALGAAEDPESRVRKSLAASLGWYREQRGAEILKRLLDDKDAGVARQAMESLSQLGMPGAPESTIVPVSAGDFQWKPLLKELSEFRLSDSRVASTLPEQKVKAGWLGEPGATEAQIPVLERRIGRRLPPSYGAFLAESNGFQQQSSFIGKLYGTDEVDWFHVRNADWAKAYRDTYPKLGSCLQISAAGDSAVVLLNPAVISTDGEWETYFFANWIPGARPYRSFREFMEGEFNRLCEWRNH